MNDAEIKPVRIRATVAVHNEWRQLVKQSPVATAAALFPLLTNRLHSEVGPDSFRPEHVYVLKDETERAMIDQLRKGSRP